jgi:hypothetical protein
METVKGETVEIRQATEEEQELLATPAMRAK